MKRHMVCKTKDNCLKKMTGFILGRRGLALHHLLLKTRDNYLLEIANWILN